MITTIATLESDLEKKTEFAEALLRSPENPFNAAKSVFPGQRQMASALHAAIRWVDDEFVLAEKKRLTRDNGKYSFLPDKADVARKVYDITSNTNDPELQLKAYKLYSDIRGFIDKPNTTINNNNAISNRVMVVKDHGDDDNWAENLKRQQQALIESSG